MVNAMNAKTMSNILKVLTVLGCVDSIYLLLTKYQCTACQSIHNSAWGKPYGIPIALFGLAGYLIQFILLLKRREKIAFIFSTIGLVVSTILIYIQFVILKSICAFCLLSGVISLSIWLNLLYVCKDLPGKKEALASGLIIILIFIAFHLPSEYSRQNPSLKPIEIGYMGANIDTISEFNKALNSSLLNSESKTSSSQNKQETVQQNDTTTKETSDNSPPKEESGNDQKEAPSNNYSNSTAHSKQLLVVYQANGNSVILDMRKTRILFFSPSCDACSDVLAQVAHLPEGKRPILVDTYIEHNKDKEIQEILSKFAKLSLSADNVLYDFDHTNPVIKIPALVGP